MTSTASPPIKEIHVEDLFPAHILPQYDPTVVQAVLTAARLGAPPLSEVPFEELRANPRKYEGPWSRDPSGLERVIPDEFETADGTAKIPVNVYYPDSEVFGKGPYGVHLNFHGGGFVLGGLHSEVQLCLSMRDAGVVVIDVNYRHCPEHAYGKFFEDGFSALQWTRASAEKLNITADSVSIGGISSGGRISIVLQHMARDAGIPLKLCMATVTGTTRCLQYRSPEESPFGSYKEYKDGPVLGWKTLKWFGENCFPGGKIEEIESTVPKLWSDTLQAPNWKGLCDTVIRTAETDPLRDEGEEYGRRLIAGGTTVTIKRYLGCPHTFPYFGFLDKKREFDKESILYLKRAHGLAI